MSMPSIDDLAAVGPRDARNRMQERRLPAAAAADEHDLLAIGHGELGNIQDRQAECRPARDRIS